MGISAVSSIMTSSFPQMNREVTAQGQQAAKTLSEEAASYSKVSNFGNETKLGSSTFQRENSTIVDIGENKAAMLMERSKSYYEVSNFGNETKLGKSSFQQENAQIMQARQKAYTQFADFQKKAGGNIDIGA